MSCLLTACVMGYSRVPVPPARIRMMPLTVSPYRGTFGLRPAATDNSSHGGTAAQVRVACRALLHGGQQALLERLGQSRSRLVLGRELEVHVGWPRQIEFRVHRVDADLPAGGVPRGDQVGDRAVVGQGH